MVDAAALVANLFPMLGAVSTLAEIRRSLEVMSAPTVFAATVNLG
jgi:hypothetical protein